MPEDGRRPPEAGSGLVIREALSTDIDALILIEANRFLAARDGMQALLIDVDSGERIPAIAQLERVLGACHLHAKWLGCDASSPHCVRSRRQAACMRPRT